MKNLTKLLGIIAIGAVIGFIPAGCEATASVSVGTIHTVTYLTGEGSGAPPASQEIMYNETITLPGQENMIAPLNKYFNGWNSGAQHYSAGTGYTVTGNVTFTAQWSSSSTPTPNPTAEEGVYVGLISFAGDATDLASNRLVYLDAAGRSALISSLDSQYRKSTASGTALFYGVHKALANLSTNAAGTSLPAEVQSVSILTFTDGLDNASFGASNTAPIEGKSGVPSAEYATYVSGEIATRQIKGKYINAYSAGVMGSDVQNTAQFNQNLTSIASSQSNVHALTDFANLQGVFSDIANNLDVSHSSSRFSMTTTMNDPGTVVRMTFDISGINSTPAQAEQSTRYIQGTLAYANSTWTLTNIQYSSGITSSSGTSITGTVSGSEVVFVFENLTGYNSSTDTPKQWTKTPGATSWQINSEYNAAGSTTTTIEKRTALIYLVLDASTSLSDDQVGQIRTAAKNFIDTLYTRSGAGPQTPPSAPTGVSATAISADSIRVSWNAVPDATSYKVYYATSNTGTYALDGTSTSNYYTSTGWGHSTTGYFKVTAVNSFGESVFSTVAYATTSSGSGSSMPWDGYTVTPLNSSTLWQTGYSLSTSSPTRWFQATTTSSNYLNTVLAARDRDYSNNYSVDVVFEVYGTDGSFQRRVDVGGGNHTTSNANFITWASPGTLYIKVVPYSYSSNYSGSFAIYFNTSSALQ
jgi:hypothetical protein